MEELNRRKAVVHIHPTAANCCRNLDYGAAPGSIEYGTDTTRAIIGVTFGGDAARYPDIRFIWSHAGGSAPFLAGRIDGGNANDRMPKGFIHEAKKFYYDTAGASNRGALASLLELVPKSQVLFGTDFPPGARAWTSRRCLPRWACSARPTCAPSNRTMRCGSCRGSKPRWPECRSSNHVSLRTSRARSCAGLATRSLPYDFLADESGPRGRERHFPVRSPAVANREVTM